MISNNRYHLGKFTLFIISIALLNSCMSVERLKYVQVDDEIANQQKIYENKLQSKVIEPFDYLYIEMYSLNDAYKNIFQASDLRTYDVQLKSYMVDENGNINLPFVGDVYVKGLNINEARKKVEESLNNYLNGISVKMRFIGNEVTVMGEVNRPGNYSFYDEKINLFEGLALAGGMRDYGDRQTVTLIREIDNKIQYETLDLTKRDVVLSDYYYLQPGDILIVNAVDAKFRRLRNYSELYLFLSLISSSIAVYGFITSKP